MTPIWKKGLACPRCSGGLSMEQYEGVSVHRCPGCGGYWVPRTGLARIVDIREKTFTPEQKQAYAEIAKKAHGLVNNEISKIDCPECGKQMKQNRYPLATEVIIDRCPSGHGVWLDAGEIEHIQMAVEAEQDEMASKVLEHGLSVDDSQSKQLLREQRRYKFRPIYWLSLAASWVWKDDYGEL